MPPKNDSPHKHCILLAHGSSDPNWKIPFEDLTLRLSERSPFVQWHLAFMEFQAPTLKTTCEMIKAENANATVKVVPLFFSRGGHVADDIPALVKEVQRSCPGLRIELGEPIGAMPEFWSAIEMILAQRLEMK